MQFWLREPFLTFPKKYLLFPENNYFEILIKEDAILVPIPIIAYFIIGIYSNQENTASINVKNTDAILHHLRKIRYLCITTIQKSLGSEF